MNIFGKREHEGMVMYFVRWTARVMSLAILFLLMLFMFETDGATGSVRPTATEWAGLTFFPLGTCLGFIIGWKNELLGGIVSVASLAFFYLVYGLGLTGHFPDGVWFAVFTLPGFLFLAYGLAYQPVFHGKHPTPLAR